MDISKIKQDIFLRAKIEYHAEWLIYYGLCIGDVVKCRFPSEHGTSKQSYHSSTECDATIILKEDGTISLRSNIPISKSHTRSNGRTGRNYKSWWVYEKEIIETEIENAILSNEQRRTT